MSLAGAKGQRHSAVMAVSFSLILLGTLYFGLRPRGYHFTNGVNWVEDGNGITFYKYGIAYTNPFKGILEGDFREKKEFSIEIGLKPAQEKRAKGFRFVLAFHNGKDREQMLIGQWRSWIIVMNGDDYDHKRRTKRISVDTSVRAHKERLFTITTGDMGTEVYIDNRLVRAKRDFTLEIPSGPQTRLVLGNSVYGRHSWGGEVYGLAVYDYALSAQDIAGHCEQWSRAKSFSFAEKANPLALYLFNEKSGPVVLDHTNRQNHIHLPTKMKILSKEVLSSRGNHLKMNKGFFGDVIINFVGFLPLGFIVAAALYHIANTFLRQHFVMAIVFCFLTSLSIEIAQAWLPSRSSQMLDLMLNTVGGFGGAAIFRVILTKAVNIQEHKR
jgi:VanZ family protein